MLDMIAPYGVVNVIYVGVRVAMRSSNAPKK